VKPHIGAGRAAFGAADDEQALIDRLSTLAPALDGEPDSEWQSRTRGRLVAMAAVRSPQPDPASPLRRLLARREGPRSLWRARLTAGLAGAAAGVVGVATVVSLSADAKPGDALYGLKRGTELTQLAMAGDERGRTLLGFASTRVEELLVVLPDEPSADVVVETLETMDTQTLDGAAWLAERALETGSSAPLEELAGWSAGQAAALDGLLESGIPSSAADDVADSTSLLERIDDRIAELRVALDCASGPATAGSDDLGPVPVDCPPPSPTTVGSAPGSGPTGEPGTPALPTPGSPSVATTAPGSETVSAAPSDSTGGSGTDPGSSEPDLPSDPATPDSTDLPSTSPPTSSPDPADTTPPPSAGGSPATSAPKSPSASSAPPSPSADTVAPLTPPSLDICVPTLPVIGGC
jgi:hypothetical protein